jgi:hypothetical protein
MFIVCYAPSARVMRLRIDCSLAFLSAGDLHVGAASHEHDMREHDSGAETMSRGSNSHRDDVR